jgi:hypothetical protein
VIDQPPKESVPSAPVGHDEFRISSGATVTPLYVQREMKVYAVHEHEIHSISMFNTLAAVFFALASFIASAGLSIWTNRMFYTELTPAGIIGANYVAPGLLLLAVIFVMVGAFAIRKRESTWKAIKKESRS